jgi:hypothetical protein
MYGVITFSAEESDEAMSFRGMAFSMGRSPLNCDLSAAER